MDIKAAETLASYGELEVRKDYSGREIYGKTTAGVTGTQEDFNNAIADLLEAGDEEDQIIVASALRNMKTDSMGLDVIFY